MSQIHAIRPALSADAPLSSIYGRLDAVFDPSCDTQSIEFAVGLADQEATRAAQRRMAQNDVRDRKADATLIKPARAIEQYPLSEEHRVSGDAAAIDEQQLGSDAVWFFPEDAGEA